MTSREKVEACIRGELLLPVNYACPACGERLVAGDKVTATYKPYESHPDEGQWLAEGQPAVEVTHCEACDCDVQLCYVKFGDGGEGLLYTDPNLINQTDLDRGLVKMAGEFKLD